MFGISVFALIVPSGFIICSSDKLIAIFGNDSGIIAEVLFYLVFSSLTTLSILFGTCSDILLLIVFSKS